MRSIRRIVHTLKGDAAACGFRELSNAAHELEDALALESAASHGSLAEIAFTAADIFGAMLAAYRGKGPNCPPSRAVGENDSRAFAGAQSAKSEGKTAKAGKKERSRSKASRRSRRLDRI